MTPYEQDELRSMLQTLDTLESLRRKAMLESARFFWRVFDRARSGEEILADAITLYNARMIGTLKVFLTHEPARRTA